MSKTYIVTKPRLFDFVNAFVPNAITVSDITSLHDGGCCLICFCTPVIIPTSILTLFQPDRSFNFHPGSPHYPGLDAHRWACYESAPSFGATLHKLTQKVDGGPIVAHIDVSVPVDAGPVAYQTLGEECAKSLFQLMAHRITFDTIPPSGAEWSGIKRLRKQTLEMCNLRGLPIEEQALRMKAFSGLPFVQ